MVRLTFYGGINEIGGNKILLEDGERGLLLDFGFPYQHYKRFYEEYLKPRSGAGLLDPLVMDLLPPLAGLYRPDLVMPNLWPRLRSHKLYRQLEPVDGVLLSHAHLDHSGHIAFLHQDIPIFSTAVTAFIAKSMQDCGKADFDQQVCYFTPTRRECPPGWGQVACLSGESQVQRQFGIGDRKPEELNPDAKRFWKWGFWKKTPRQKEFISRPLKAHTVCRFKLRCFPIDHSIPGACAWGIETSAGWVIYSGDLRRHGKRGHLTQSFLKVTSSLHPRALILEGTNVNRGTNVAEREVYHNGLRVIAGSRKLVIADFSPRDVDRLLTFLQIAQDTGRKLAVLPKDAYLLKTMRLLEPEIPDLNQEPNLVIYQETIASKYPHLWIRNLCHEYASKIVLAEDINSAQDQFILCFSFFDLNELPSLHPKAGSLYVYSSSEPHDEEQAIDFQRLGNWLKHFRLKGFGMPVKRGNSWRIPRGEEGLHASGHASGPDLLEIAREIKPEILLPVHSLEPDFYAKNLSQNKIEVILPKLGETIAI